MIPAQGENTQALTLSVYVSLLFWFPLYNLTVLLHIQRIPTSVLIEMNRHAECMNAPMNTNVWSGVH